MSGCRSAATYDSVAFRFVAANQHPDHDTIATFRRRFLNQIEALFVQVLGVAREMGVLKLAEVAKGSACVSMWNGYGGTVALDGTKIHANASRHSALSYEHATKIEAQLKAEVADLLDRAERADQSDVPDGMQIPEELARREKRLAAIARAKRGDRGACARSAMRASGPSMRPRWRRARRSTAADRQQAQRARAAAADGGSTAH